MHQIPSLGFQFSVGSLERFNHEIRICIPQENPAAAPVSTQTGHQSTLKFIIKSNQIILEDYAWAKNGTKTNFNRKSIDQRPRKSGEICSGTAYRYIIYKLDYNKTVEYIVINL